MPLQETFSLTPQNMHNIISLDQQAYISAFGVSFFWPITKNFNTQYSDDKLYYTHCNAVDPSVDYAMWTNRQTVPHIELFYNLSALGEHKELALVFSFEVIEESRLLIYTDDGLLDEETLIVGDNQFLIEVESLDPLHLYFIHTRLESSPSGGRWFFKGIAGYVV